MVRNTEISEIMLKTALNILQPISHSINQPICIVKILSVLTSIKFVTGVELP